MSSKKNKKKTFFFWTNPRFFKDKVDKPKSSTKFQVLPVRNRYFPPWHCKLSIDLVVLKIQPRTRIPFFLALTNMFFTIGWYIRDIPKKRSQGIQSWCSAPIAIEVVPSEEPITAFQVQQSRSTSEGSYSTCFLHSIE